MYVEISSISPAQAIPPYNLLLDNDIDITNSRDNGQQKIHNQEHYKKSLNVAIAPIQVYFKVLKPIYFKEWESLESHS